jgi:gliding motility-associated-like protein
MSKLLKITLTPLFVLLFISIYGQVPTISSFSPTSGDVGTTVTITGSNFSTTLANNIVYFGAAKATVSAATATSLTVTVPGRSTYEPISVINTSLGKVAQSKIPFKVTNSTISSFPVSSSSFVAPVNITAAAGASNWYEIGDMISVADYDGDGKPDIAKGSNTTSVNVLRNVITTSGSIATSSFSSAGNFTTGSASFEIASGDIDGDGKLDIVSIGTSNFSILRNTSTSGTISFATKVDVAASYQYRVKLADIDGDGRLDVITSSNYSSNFNVYLNTSSVGNISFNATPTTISGLNGSRHITIGDINMDGKTDIIAANEGTMNALLFLNTSTSGSVSFGSGIAVAGGYWYNSVGDFDGDGKNDILSNGGNVSLLTNNYTSGTFTSSNLTTASNISSADGLSYTTQSDFNGDGKLDYFTSFQNGGSYVYWYKNNYTSGSFSSSSFAANSATFSTPYQMIICDFDGDGKQDIVSSASSNLYVQIARNKIGEDPTITTSGTLSAFTTCSGLNSSNQSFNVSGSNLTANISLTAPTGFEISTSSGSGFASSLTLTQSSGTVASTTIYVRTTTAATGNPSGNIVLSSTGATSVNVAASGTINALPTISGTLTTTTIGTTQLTGSATANASTPWQSANTGVATISNTGLVSGVSVGTSIITYTNTNGCIITATVNVTVPPPVITTVGTLSAFAKCSGLTSSAQTFTVAGQYLTANIAIAALTGFEYSTDGTTYASTLSLAPTSGTLNTTTVYVRMTAAVATNPSGNIVLSSTGATTVNVAASGTINALPSITGTLTTTTIGTTQLTGSATANASTPWQSANTGVATISNTGLVSGVSVGTSTITYTNTNGCIKTALVTVTVPPPAISTTGTLSAFTKCSGNVSNAQTFTVTGQYLTANIALAALTGFEYSTDGTTYASTLSLAPTSGTLNATTVYVRMTGAVATNPSGNIVLSTTGGSNVNIAASGTINALPTITGTTYLTTNGTAQLTGSGTANSNNPWISSNTNVLTVNSTGAISAVSVGTSTITYTNSNGCSISTIASVNNPAPKISSFSPISGIAGSSITITGTDFSANNANNIVLFGSVKGTVTASTSTSLTVTVPAGAKVSSIKIINTENNLSGVSSNSFVPTYTNANPGNLASTNFTALQMTTATSPAAVTSATWSGVRHNGAVYDIDGDGKVDLLMVDNANSRVAIYSNAATSGSLSIANFSTVTYAATISTPTDIEVEDINNDGKPDMVVTNGGTSLSILINTSTIGNISFAAKQDFTVASSMIVRVADLNEDGRPDIITAARGASSVNIYSNTTTLPSNTITLSAATNLTGATSIFDIVIKDINNDNKPDINLAASTYYAFINTNTVPNTLSFTQTMSKATTAGLYSLQVEDYNLDGKNDVVFGFMGAVNGGMFQNNYSSGNIANTDFSTEITINNLSNSSSQYAWQLQSGDFNGDGKPDILNTDFNAGSNVRIVTNNNTMGSGNTLSTANFSGAYIGTSSSYGNSFAVDLDNDGKPDWANFSNNRIDIGRNKIGEDPTITKSSNFSAFVTCPSTASPSQTFTVSGTYLTANITVAAPTGYEVSTSAASGYTTSLTLTQTNGVVTNTSIYIRLATTASGTPAGNISISSTGATTQTIAVTGSINSVPSISVQPSTTAQSKCINVAATPLTVTAAGTNIAYQWYSNTSNSNTGGTAITGANSATYTPSTSTAGALYYYVVVSGTCTPNATSNVSGLVTTNALPTVTIGSITNPIATATSFSLPYTSATGTPNQYSITVGSSNIMSSFVAVNNGTLSTSPISVTIPASIANTYDFNLVVKNSTTGCSSNNIPFSITVNKATPTLTGFATITKTFGAANFNITNPTSASTGTFSYTISDPTVATISGNTVTIVGAGTATITATQATDNSYNTASISTTLTVSKALPTLSNFGSISKVFGDNAFTLTDPTSASTGTFSYTSSNNNVVSISGNTVTIVGAGTATITATQASDPNYNSNSIASTITVSKIAPTISNFSNLTNNYGDAAFVLTAPTSNSNGSFTYSSSNTNVATIAGSTVTIVGAGTTTITATQATTNNYNTSSISALLTVNKIDPTISNFNAINKVYGSAPFTVTAPSSNSNGSFTYSISDPNVATINDSIITIVGAGTASITATQAGNNNFTNNNNTISANITVSKATPTQSGFNNMNKIIGDADFALTNPNSNSTGGFTFTSSDTNIATVTGNMVSIVSTGTVTITATQSADNNYDAKSITATLNITKPNPTLSNFGNIIKTYGDADFIITDPTSNSNGNFTYTSSNTNIASIVGSTISIIGSGTVTITASQASTSSYNAGVISATITINKANPSLTGFNSINKTFGDGSFSITAPNSNSNGIFTYASSNTSVATISGTTISIVGAGTATITATQASNTNYNSGNITTTLTVAKANPSFGNFNSVTKSVGDANFNIAAPTSNSSGAITYSISDLTVATVTGSNVSIIGAGTATITASQASTNNFNAGTITTTITVTQANPTITGFTNINKVYGNSPFALTAPTSNSNGLFSFTSSNSNVVSIVGNIATIVGAGTASITATQASTNNYNTGSITASIIVSKANPTITGFNTINKTYGDTSFSITSPISNSTGTFTYTSSNNSIAVVSGNNINIIGAGTATITATQSNDNNYNGGTISTSIVIAKANPVLGTFNSYNKSIGDASFTITAPLSNSNGNITYTSSNLNVATVTGSTVNIIGAGTTTITATQASTNNYNAGIATTTITVGQSLPTIAGFNNINKTFGDGNFTLTNPTSNSNGTFTYSSSNSNVATINGNIVTIIGAGTTTITANQSSTNNYSAGSITAILSVAKANPVIANINPITKYVGDSDFTINDPSSNSNGQFTYTSSNANVASIINGNTVRIIGQGTSTLTATQASSNNYNSRSVSTTITVLEQINNIRLVNDSFNTHIDTLFSNNISLNDSAPSVTYGNVVPDINNISGATLNLQSNGIFSFNASQPGIYKYTISGCSANNQQNCPTSLLIIKANYLPQGSINLYYNTLLATDTAKLVTNISNGIAPYSIVIKNNKDTVKQSFYNLSNSNTLLLAPRKDSAIYSILYIKDANNVTRYNRFSKDTANLHIVKPDILLTLKATPPQPISDSTLQMNLLLSIENRGVVDVNGVQVLADLTKVFPPGMEYILDSVSTVDSTILLNPNYTGVNTTLRTNSTNSFSVSTVRSNSTVLSQAELFNFGVNLLKQQKGNVNFKFRIKPNAVTKPLVLQFSSTGNALLKQNDGSVSTTPAKTTSTDGANPSNSNKPIPTYVPIVPVNYIGAALEGSLPTVVNGGYVFHYNTLIKNYSNGNLDAVNAILDLSNSFIRPDSAYITFGTTNNSNIVFNSNFDGYNDKRLFSNLGLLAVGDTLLAGFDIHVRTNKLQYAWPLSITTNAVTSLYNTPVSDESFNGTNPDPNNDQKPEEKSITISSVGFTAPANPTVRSLVYSLGNPSNPTDVSNMIISTPTGTIPSWCDVNGGNCNVIAPSLPTTSGKFIWCIKAYDTLSGQYSTNCRMDTLTMLPSLTARKLTYVKTVTTNPSNIASSIVAISSGSIVRWCDANGNNCSFNTPATPSNIGTYIWTISAVDTANNLVSAGVIKDTVNILDPYRVVDLTKRLDEVSMNPDGSFNIKFNFVVSNNSGQILNNIVIRDNLTNVFGNNVEYTVLSLKNTGYLNVNNSYNGVTDINLVNNNVILLNNKQDTVQLTLLVKGNRIDGNYSNSASAVVNTNYGTFTITSNDPILNPTNTNNRIATNFVIPKLDVIVAGGFSPNNDGIDDTWIIERPYGTKIAVRVFNRWGNEVFQSDDYLNDWRGKGQNNFLGTDIPEGTYFYAVIVTTNDNKTYKLSGSLTIVK